MRSKHEQRKNNHDQRQTGLCNLIMAEPRATISIDIALNERGIKLLEAMQAFELAMKEARLMLILPHQLSHIKLISETNRTAQKIHKAILDWDEIKKNLIE